MDLSGTVVHFEWSPESVVPRAATWNSWGRHPAGEALAVLLSGRVDLIQEVDGEPRAVELHPGEAVVNARHVWPTALVHEPGDAWFVTPGRGTEGGSR